MKAEKHTIPSSSHGPSEGERRRGEGRAEEGPLLPGWGSGSRGPAPTLHVLLANHAPQGGRFCPALFPWKAGETAVF